MNQGEFQLANDPMTEEHQESDGQNPAKMNLILLAKAS